jgi:hypothetical protein
MKQASKQDETQFTTLKNGAFLHFNPLALVYSVLDQTQDLNFILTILLHYYTLF